MTKRQLCGLIVTFVILAAGCSSMPKQPVDSGSGFVSVSGCEFVIDGEVHRFTGVNFWSAMNLAVDGPDGDRERLVAELDLLQSAGVRNLRVMAATEGPSTEPYRVAPAMNEGQGEVDNRLLEGLDFLLVECAKRELRLVMVLTNFWEWSGGMAQFVSWHEHSEIPYPATNDWRDFTAYSSRFYNCEPCQQMYREVIERVVTRVNRLTGLPYRDDPTIFAWELANEPRLYPAEWIDQSAAYIKSLDPRHLVTTGSEGEVGGDFVATHDGPHIDYATIHVWPQNWGWFDPERPETFDSALEEALKYLRQHEEMAGAFHKPVVLEEFGLARDWKEGESIYDPDASTSYRDRFFAAMFAEVERSARQGGPLVGDSLWVWGGQGRPGDRWVGDPPHEKPGWYSVFDSDASTLDLIREHAATLAAIRVESDAGTRR